MAWTVFEDKILARGLRALRETARLPRLVNRGYERTAANRPGTTVEIPVAGAVQSYDIAASHTQRDFGTPNPTMARVEVDKWKGAGFELVDKDRAAINSGEAVETQATEAVRTLANDVNSDIASKFVALYGTAGTAGATPFSTVNDLSDAVAAKQRLDTQLCPGGSRFGLLTPAAEGKFLNQTGIQRVDASGASQTLREGAIGRVMGTDWWGNNQFVPTHDTRALTTGAILVDKASGYSAGDTTIHMDAFAAAATRPKRGDVCSFGGTAFDPDASYVVVNDPASGTEADVEISPPLRAAVVDNVKVWFLADHEVSIVAHRDCFALVSRPLGSAAQGANFRTVPDPVTGLVLRLEIIRQNKQDAYEWDIHWGSACVDPRLGARLLG